MKLGIIISIVIVAFFGLLAFFVFRGVADAPTSATRPEQLAAVTPPQDAPPLFTPTRPEADATPRYREAFELYQRQPGVFDRGTPSPAVLGQVTDLLQRAADAGQVQPGWLDDQIPMRFNADPEFGAALEQVSAAALIRAEQLYEAQQYEASVQVLRSVWALGYRAFTQNQRMYPRTQGLYIMDQALFPMRSMAGETGLDPEALTTWQQWVEQALQRYEDKMKIVLAVEPQMGDLFNIARNDQDPAFRLTGVMRLGLAKFHAGSRGNKRVVLALIEQAKSSDDPLIAEAGRAADETTAEDVRLLR